MRLNSFFWVNSIKTLKALINDVIYETGQGEAGTADGRILKTHGFAFLYCSEIHKMAFKVSNRGVEVKITDKTLCHLLGFYQCEFLIHPMCTQLHIYWIWILVFIP